MKQCFNHPDKNAISICHGCGKNYCELCLDEGKEYYYCKMSECQILLEKELPENKLPADIICPNCEAELVPSEAEIISGKLHCPECETLIDFGKIPPQVIIKEDYVELLSTMNQGDIALIKSILNDANIDYFVFDENFLNVNPLLQSARFFVNVDRVDDAKELLKDIELSVWGVSRNQDK